MATDNVKQRTLYIKIDDAYYPMIKYESDGNAEEIFDAKYDDDTGELIWVKR